MCTAACLERVRFHTGFGRIQSCLHGTACRRTNRTGGVCIVEYNTLFCQLVEHRRFADGIAPICRQRIFAMLVCADENDILPFYCKKSPLWILICNNIFIISQYKIECNEENEIVCSDIYNRLSSFCFLIFKELKDKYI